MKKILFTLLVLVLIVVFIMLFLKITQKNHGLVSSISTNNTLKKIYAMAIENSEKKEIDAKYLLNLLTSTGVRDKIELASDMNFSSIYITAKAVRIGSQNYLVAIQQKDKKIFAINGSKKITELDHIKFKEWSHVSVSLIEARKRKIINGIINQRFSNGKEKTGAPIKEKRGQAPAIDRD